ncbi:hypothetical protein SDC9_152490 [bioreactor metagenome]|uniref:Uncharacterized protein n=1 Tax=bioreactor metagenome TaxID=1076179 RepID=A0A645EUV8_9ZZZZ
MVGQGVPFDHIDRHFCSQPHIVLAGREGSPQPAAHNIHVWLVDGDPQRDVILQSRDHLAHELFEQSRGGLVFPAARFH